MKRRDGGIHLTIPMLNKAYAFLLTTEPFNKWKLPHPDEMTFRITRKHDELGHCTTNDKNHIVIALSEKLHGSASSILCTMAHEMCHVRQLQRGWPINHGHKFVEMATTVCRAHIWDLRGF